MSYDTIALAYHPRRRKSIKDQTPVKELSHSNPQNRNSQANTNLMIEIKMSVQDVGDSPHAQGFNCPAKKYQCKHSSKIRHFTKMCFTKSAHLQLQHYHKSKPKQAHQIIVPHHSTKQYQNTHVFDNVDDCMIAFQLRAQPQKSVHNQQVTTGYTQEHLYAILGVDFLYC